ncbi:hypothetical protein BDQ17DRAFT_1388801 [Cyathus striatus]|nr:hypothetical protein BDQ17DRAFT_1388801 [Cyathus striatus]
MRPKDFKWYLPKPIIITVLANEKPLQAMIDTGFMADFLLTTVVDQLALKTDKLAKPITVQLAVHGSRSKINVSTVVDFKYQEIDSNLDNYDMILGTPFIFQHKVVLSMNPMRIAIGSKEPLELKGEEVSSINSAAADLFDTDLVQLHSKLRTKTTGLCPDTSKIDLQVSTVPPFRAVNHIIPLIDENKVYKFRPA